MYRIVSQLTSLLLALSGSQFFLPSPPLAPCLRALLGTPRTGMDFSAAVVETKVTEDNDDPSVR